MHAPGVDELAAAGSEEAGGVFAVTEAHFGVVAEGGAGGQGTGDDGDGGGGLFDGGVDGGEELGICFGVRGSATPFKLQVGLVPDDDVGDATLMLALRKCHHIIAVGCIHMGCQKAIATIGGSCPGGYDIEAGDDGDAPGVGMIDDHVKPPPIIAVLRAWLGIGPRKEFDNPRGTHSRHQIELVGNECFINHTRQAGMDGGFGIVGGDNLWLWERERRHLSLDHQCIDGAADGDNDAQQNKQFLHDTSIA